MDEKGVSGSFIFISEENIDSLYPMLFGVSCAFFALRLLPEPEMCDGKWSEIRNRMLKGSAHLLGLLLWRVQREEAKSGQLLQKLENAQKQIQELKKRRSEEAKANEKVVSIVAAREQSWFDERRKLRQQIAALMNELRVVEMKKEKSISELNEKLKENEAILQLKDKSFEEGEQKRREIEEKVKAAENLVDELRENVKREAQRHSSELSRHKTAIIELVSNQRQLEAELGRAVRQVEAAKQELDSVLEQKEQSIVMTQRLSIELLKMRKDLEQKDQILSAMLRKSKLDTAEKQMLLKEVKSSKAKNKQAELETARWKAVSEPKHERQSLRNMFAKHVDVKSDVRKGVEVFSLVSDPYLTEGTDKTQSVADVDHLENWEDSESHKIAMEERHNLEIDAFAEQLSIKDEKLEAFRWRLLSTEIESKRLQSHIEGLDQEITQLRQENMKLEALLLDRNAELHSLKEQLVLQFNPPNLQKLNFNSINHDTVWSKVKVIKRKPGQKRQELKAIAEGISQAVEDKKVDDMPANEQVKDIVLTLQNPHKELQEGKVAAMEPDHLRRESIDSDDIANAETSTSLGQGPSRKTTSTWKMDIHALGVSYKIKRLKQQFLMLERLTGKQENSENNNGYSGVKGFHALTSLLNKQVDRYQSLQGKTDDLCQRMHEKNLNLNGGLAIARTEDETKKLEQFLEETFQLQRYIVATGQKLMEVQTKIASGLVGYVEKIEKPESFDVERFADSIFREVQRGLEVRISRIIGDLEGTLACDGIIHLKR
ncbi:myosin heavy chain, striated muscle [Sesamum indicum]|uniref:Myosin heavy chain, striated muscle n=1 Tax=Sesamum indicum TaxID=4182 RepID=A0A6I9T1W0_SESIN|nr:myosin heavy chain, striated muscle [Sesamum indicum]